VLAVLRASAVATEGFGRRGSGVPEMVPATAAPMIVGLFEESTKKEHHDGRAGEDDG
jgi:hypothetical protein